MKNFYAILFMVCFLCIEAIVYGNSSQQTKADTILLLSGKRIIGKVTGVTSSKVSCQVFPSNKIESTERKQIQKIIYSNGRIEEFNKSVFEMVQQGDYKAVILTENPMDVIGMVRKGDVEATSSKSSKSKKTSRRSAEIQIQKKAANLGANIVLIKKREAKGGYGEVPVYFIVGTAYSYE